jgi:membrane protease YdiL (CAAX protease family)
MKKEYAKTAWILGGASTFMLTFIIIAIARNGFSAFFNAIGFNQSAREIPLAWVLAAAVTIGYIAFTTFGMSTVKENFFKFDRLKLIGIYAALTSGILEELLFRQILMDLLYDRGIGIVFQIGISGVVFGLAHFSWGLIKGDWKTGLGSAIATTILGLLLATVYIVAGRNVLPAIMSHMTINIFLEPWMILHAIKNDSVPEDKDVAQD